MDVSARIRRCAILWAAVPALLLQGMLSFIPHTHPVACHAPGDHQESSADSAQDPAVGARCLACSVQSSTMALGVVALGGISEKVEPGTLNVVALRILPPDQQLCPARGPPLPT